MDGHYLVLSDMHFGTPQSSINLARYREPLVQHIADGAPWSEIIFTGDLLDANLSSLKQAIEGADRDGVVGFRTFVEAIDGAMKRSGRKGLAQATGRWVYVPGNHDYKVWDLLSTRYAFEDVLARGERLDTNVTMPVAQHAWPDGSSFFAGIFRPFGADHDVTVEYPNHEVQFGPPSATSTMVFTHGHYLDPSQTRGNELPAHLASADPKELASAVRHIVVETAQYQAVASAVSYTRDMRRAVAALVGPDGAADKVRKVWTAAGAWVLKHVFGRDGAMRGKSISPKELGSIRAYLTRFCSVGPSPRWFVFGHTHRQDRGEITGEPSIQVFNVGSCYPDHGLPITFLEVDRKEDGQPAVHLMCVDAAASVGESPAFRGTP